MIITTTMAFKCNLAYEELELDELKQIEQRMYPGMMSDTGFLQEGETLNEVYQADKSFLTSINISYDQIADRLQTILGKYYRLMGAKSWIMYRWWSKIFMR